MHSFQCPSSVSIPVSVHLSVSETKRQIEKNVKNAKSKTDRQTARYLEHSCETESKGGCWSEA